MTTPKVFSLNTVYNGDSAVILKTFPDACIDLVVTSPPYDDLRTYNGFSFDFPVIAKELYRVMKPGACLVWVVNDATKAGSETSTSFRQLLGFKDIGFNIHDTMIYEKNSSPFPAKRDGTRYSGIFEFMWVLSKGKPKTAHLICDKKNRWEGWVGFGKVTQRGPNGELVEYDRKPTPAFSPRNNIWTYYTGKNFTSKDEAVRGHPAAFPDLLAMDHIRTWSNEGDVVLDPFMGSGTVAAMAQLLNRNYVGIELSSEYCEVIEKRLEFKHDLEKMLERSAKEVNSRYPNDEQQKLNTAELIRRKINGLENNIVALGQELMDTRKLLENFKEEDTHVIS